MQSESNCAPPSSLAIDDTERVRQLRRLITLLAAVSNAIRRDAATISPEFADRGTWGDLELLGRIYFAHDGEARPSQLTGFTYTTSAGVTGSLRRLENEGYSGGAMWEDSKVGFGHWTKFERIALVTDHAGYRDGANAVGWMIPGGFKTFSVAELDAAKAWVSE